MHVAINPELFKNEYEKRDWKTGVTRFLGNPVAFRYDQNEGLLAYFSDNRWYPFRALSTYDPEENSNYMPG